MPQKVILIAGVNGALDTQVTQACLDAGYRVAGVSPGIADRDFTGPNFAAFPTTLNAASESVRVIKGIRSHWGRLDALVQLGGAFAGGQPFTETEVDTFTCMLEVNLLSFVYAVRAVLPMLQAQGSGTLLAMQAGVGAYAASKAALVSLVQTLARENREFGVSANVILPGTIDTPANRKAMPQADHSQWVQPSQVAALIVHLLSDQGTQISGAVIPVHGRQL